MTDLIAGFVRPRPPHASMSDSLSSASSETLACVLNQAQASGVGLESLVYLLQAACEQLPTGVYAKDAQGRYLFVNAAAAAVLGHSVQDVLGHTDEELLDAEAAAVLKEGDDAARAQRLPLQREEKLTSRDLVCTRMAVSLDGHGVGLAGLWLDFSELRRAKAQLKHALDLLEQQRYNEDLRQELKDQGVRDALTGVYNRRHFDEQLRREVDLSAREHREFALVAIQVDDHEDLRARHGQQAADRCLQALGQLLRGNTRAMDAPCRIGIDRFAVLLSGVGLATAYARMEGVRRQCEAQIVMQDGQDVRFTVSMGVASFPHSSDELPGLLRLAERALATAQQRGGNGVVLAAIPFFPPERVAA
jgi:diguanylate cyclase (GGDEF)-like protein/PAS domain S-box-containing protein